MENEMNGQYVWSKSGLELLNEINNYIEFNGGINEVLMSIRDEDRKIREQQYKNSLINPGRKGILRQRKRRTKKVVLTQRGRFKIFNSSYTAAKYFGVTDGFIRNAIIKNHKCKGWEVRHAKKSA